jgi:hypothetical protein
MPHAFDTAPYQIDHIIAEQHGGPTTRENLALSCLHCNKHKGPNLAGLDPLTGQLQRLFHPRQDRWEDHFCWNGPRLVGLTAIGRTTIRVLAINAPLCVAARAELLAEGVFPP